MLKVRGSSAPIEVIMPDGSTALVTRILTIPVKRKEGHVNWKLNHTNETDTEFFVVGVSLAPADASGYEVCASRSEGCTEACLARSGFGFFFPAIPRGRIAKTILFFEHRQMFLDKLFRDLEAVKRKVVAGYGRRLAVRLNVFSDLLWEKMVPQLFTHFADVQFYDYTKHYKRMLSFCAGKLPSNYYLTFSRSEKNWRQAMSILRRGGNIAVPFRGPIPAQYYGQEVINGDESDLRFKDKRPVVVGLRAKGVFGKRDKTGFVVRRIPLPVL